MSKRIGGSRHSKFSLLNVVKRVALLSLGCKKPQIKHTASILDVCYWGSKKPAVLLLVTFVRVGQVDE
ncbi:hypothetical protein LC609_20890 [Nostoc sp. XA013]|nr:hypothetical protein [Nostoc sp. XA013]